MLVDFEFPRDELVNVRGSDRPVGEQQIVPGLPSDPGTRRQWPGPVFGERQTGMCHVRTLYREFLDETRRRVFVAALLRVNDL